MYHRPQHGFTVPEALIGIVVLSLSGAALLTSFEMALDTGVESVNQLQAQGVATRLMEEICRLRYVEPGQPWSQLPLGPEAGEVTRADFDDIDDYHGLTSSPTDRWGVALGSGDGAGGVRQPTLRVDNNKMTNWRTRVLVQYVLDSDHSTVSAAATRFRRITVYVEELRDGTWFPIATSRRVVGYAPSLAN